ncbi:MAG: sensor domain-containing diguanylate cyclase [Micromonosporaceae bacterium]|nr:sensor domain-containing diguanylate cyclase [Micromonosporaceae bacterium]
MTPVFSDARRGVFRTAGLVRSRPQQRTEALVTIAGAVLETVNHEQRLAARVADIAATTLCGSAGVWLARTDTGETWWATEGYGELEQDVADQLCEHVREQLADSMDGVATPVVLAGGQARSAEWLGEMGLGMYALFPIVAGGRLLGGLAFIWPNDALPLATEDVEYAKTLAGLAGVTMFNARILADSAVAMEELRAQSELIEDMSDAVISCDAEGRVVSWNAGAERVYGYSNAEAAGCDLFALLNTEFLNAEETVVPREEVLRLAAEGEWRGECRERRSDGAALITDASLNGRSDRDGRLELILVNRDITAQRREEHEALHDALTGLPNRRMLTLKLYDAYARACRHQRSLAVLFIDLDGFKPINDTYGHAAGDEVLKAVASRITATLRVTDTVARIGGDEFVVVLQETGDRDSVVEVTRRILDSVAEPVEIGATSVKVLASIGIAHAVEPTIDGAADDLLDAADLAMYEAKRQRIGMAFSEPDD